MRCGNIFTLPDIGLLGYFLNHTLGISYDMTQDPVAAWVDDHRYGCLALDVPGGAALSYAGLVAIPDAYYQAAKIDGASNWAVSSATSSCPR